MIIHIRMFVNGVFGGDIYLPRDNSSWNITSCTSFGYLAGNEKESEMVSGN